MVFRTQSNICGGVLLQKEFMAKICLLFLQKRYVIDVGLCSKYAYKLYFKFGKTPLTKYTNACVGKP